jgi:hypothetical protein
MPFESFYKITGATYIMRVNRAFEDINRGVSTPKHAGAGAWKQQALEVIKKAHLRANALRWAKVEPEGFEPSSR